MPASLDYLFAAFDQSTDSQCFATVTQAIERHRLRIYSVGSNQLTHDYELKNGESITSLAWGHVLANQPEDAKKKQVKKAKAKKPSSLDKVVLLGTDKGSILLYSVDQDKVTKTVPGNGQVIDALINDLGTTIYSLSNSGTLIAWSLEDAQPVSEWKTKLKGAHKLALDHEASLLAVAGQGKIELWDLVKGKIVKTIKSSDKHSIDNLVFTKHNNTLISTGKTTIDLWSTKADITEPTQSISVEEGVQKVDLISATNDDDMTLLVVTNKGNVHVWKSTKQSGLKTTTTIKIMDSKQNQVPILYAKFTKLQKQTAIAIARGSSAKPVLETVSITDGKNKPLRDIVLTRQTAGATHSNMESDDEDETQKEDMDIDPTIQHTPEKLVKALQLDNKTTIINYVEQTTDADAVDNTIRQLPIAYIRPLVLLLVDEIESKPASDVSVQLLWLKRMVSFHYQHLMDDSTIVKKLAALSQVLTVHATETFPKVIALRGRVEMIQQQLDLRSKRAQLDEEDALLDLEPMEDSDAEDSEDEDSGNDDDDDDDLDDFEEDDDEDDVSGHRHIKDEDMFLEEMAEDDVVDDDADSDIDDSDASIVSELFDGDVDEEKREEQLVAESHRYESFAPVRHGAQVKHFVDGQDYCWAVSEAIEQAKEVIFIEDWWLTPELYMRRPCAKYPEYRLDALLQRKAEEGVKIYIVVYKEVRLALTLDSKHTKETLQALHENIIVQRHPNHDVGGTFFWSHHEKFVVIDNKIAFLGGIDLCFGRWDTHAHRLADFVEEDPILEVYPGQDYSDARVRDFEEVKNWDMRLIDKTVVPRMPWHDMSLCMLGGPVLDVARHFCERWNFVKNEKAKNNEAIPYLQPPLGGFAGNQHQRFEIPNEDEPAWQRRRYRHGTRGVTGTCRAQVVRSSADWSLGINLEHSIQNAYIEAILGAKHFVHIENQFFITATSEDKDYILKNQIGAAIVKRIVRAHEEQEKFKVFVLMPLMPAFPADLSTKEAATARLVMHYQYISICRGGKSIIEQLEAAGINASDYIRFYSLRSHDRIKRSVVEDVLTTVEGYSAREDIEDEVEFATVGEYGSEHRHGHHRRRHHQSRTPWLSHDFVSEELYIHAKLLIADDRLVIMGSSNLNDRSQCGDRDSEIALVVEDKEMVPSKVNGQDCEVSKFATQLRRKLWKEHLGLLPDQPTDKVTDDMLPLPVPQIDTLSSREDQLVQDPLDEDTLNLWNSTARKNTEAFREVFHCVPDDTVTTWEEYHAFYPDPEKIEIGHVHDPEMPVEDIVATLDQVRGHLVEFPLKFLEQVDLQGESVPFLGDDINELYT